MGLNKSNITIWSGEFLEEIKAIKQCNLAVELLERLTKQYILHFIFKKIIRKFIINIFVPQIKENVTRIKV